MMRLTAISLLATGVMASNSTATSASSATTPAPQGVCSTPSAAMMTALNSTAMAAPLYTGMQDPQCCDAMRDSMIQGLGPMGMTDGACWSMNGCGNENSTAYGHNAATNSTQKQVATNTNYADWYKGRAYICSNPDCTFDHMTGLWANAATHPTNMMLFGVSNYSDFCNVRFRNDLVADIAAGHFYAGADATTYNGYIADIDANHVKIGEKQALATANYAAATAAALAAAATTPAPSAGSNETSTPAITVSGSLTVGFTVPANATAASLAADSAFKTALAASIKASLTDLPTTATVSITGIAVAARRSLMAAIANKRRLATLNLKVDYEISGVTKAQADAVYTEIANNADTFAAAVKSNSVAQFTSAGLTGYSVDSVVAAAPTMAGATPATAPVVLDDEASSGAFSVAASSALAIAAVATMF